MTGKSRSWRPSTTSPMEMAARCWDRTDIPSRSQTRAADLPVGVFNIQYQDGLERAGSERFLMNDKNGAVWVSGAKLQRGYLESSNADLATELTGVIEAQRSYSYALKMVATADEVETTVNGLANV